jgi:hypothetical protein
MAVVIAPDLPNAEQLRPALEKLEAVPGSVVLLAIESAEPCCNFCRVTVAWLAPEERKALRRALEVCRAASARKARLRAHNGDSAVVSQPS